jgi:hypothetical protein
VSLGVCAKFGFLEDLGSLGKLEKLVFLVDQAEVLGLLLRGSAAAYQFLTYPTKSE